MGQCATSTVNISSPQYDDIKKNIDPAINWLIFQNKTADKRFLNDVFPRKRVYLSEPSPEESYRSDYVSSVHSSSIASTRKPETTDRTASECSTYSVKSSTWSDSFTSADLVSFDGRNKRVINRNDLGLEVIKATIHFGADPQGMSTHGERSCLMVAVIGNDYELTKKLVKLGVDVNKRTRIGETALGLAIELKRDKIASFLRLNGAKQ